MSQYSSFCAACVFLTISFSVYPSPCLSSPLLLTFSLFALPPLPLNHFIPNSVPSFLLRLSLNSSILSVSVLAVKTKTIPAWNEALAARVRDGMTLQGTYVFTDSCAVLYCRSTYTFYLSRTDLLVCCTGSTCVCCHVRSAL